MRKKKLLLLLPLLFLYVGCDKDSDSTPPPPAYVGEYDLTQVIFECGDNQGLSVTDETNIIDGELV